MAKTATTPTATPAAEPADLGELLQAKAELDAKIAAIQKAGRAEAVQKAKDFIAKHGLTVTDLFPGTSASKPAKRTIARPAAKYRDSEGNTWTGRGFKPVWLRNRLAAGAKLEDFLIDQAL